MNEQELDAAADHRTHVEAVHFAQMIDAIGDAFSGKPAREMLAACFEATGEELGLDLDEEELDEVLTAEEVVSHVQELSDFGLRDFYNKECV